MAKQQVLLITILETDKILRKITKSTLPDKIALHFNYQTYNYRVLLCR